MNETEALSKLIPPGQRRPWKPAQGVIQILVTSSCDLACHNCTQASNVRRPHWAMTPTQFETAVQSLAGYFGTVGVFGGNPALSKHFPAYCEILSRHFPKKQRGLWCNHPRGHGAVMRETFNPGVSNLNVHRSQEAYAEFKRDWPESNPFGLTEQDEGRHAPVFVSMRQMDRLRMPDGREVENTEENRWELISTCDLNRHWSAGIGVVCDSVLGYFCEIAMAQAILTSDPSTGAPVEPGWWRRPMSAFAEQARRHCHGCGVPLRGYGQRSTAPLGVSQVSWGYQPVYEPRRGGVEVVTTVEELKAQALGKFTEYRKNSRL